MHKSRIYQVIEDMKTMGVSSEDVIEDILESRLKNKSEVKTINNGEFKVPNLMIKHLKIIRKIKIRRSNSSS